MSRFYAMSQNGISIHYKCRKLKKPFRKLCEYDDPRFSDCIPCKYFKAEMRARDAERLLKLLAKKGEVDNEQIEHEG